jgi:protein O-GlcNAc transferase
MPDFEELYATGMSRFDEERWEESATAFREALALNPTHAGAWSNLGAAEQQGGKILAARAAYDRCLSIDPCNAEAILNYARLECEAGQPRRALDFVRSLADERQSTARHVIQGIAHRMLGELAEAESELREALKESATHESAQYHLADVLYGQNRYWEAEIILRLILVKAPLDKECLKLLALALHGQGRTQEARSLLGDAVAAHDDPDLEHTLLWLMQYADDASPQKLLQAHREWDALYARRFIAANSIVSRRHHESQRLRLGFISGDFGQHPVGFLALPALEHLDKARCSITCYSDRIVEDELTSRFRSTADEWNVTAGLTNEELAQQVRKDRIDILCDLVGHFGHRIPVFAEKPAPIQISWLGYVGTTGLSAIDFLLADRFHIPRGDEPYYVEEVLRMPHDYICYGPPAYASPVAPLPALSAGFVTFGCFNAPAKYSAATLDAWASILQCVPNSRLYLKYMGLHEAQTQRRLLSLFAARGIAANRLLFEGFSSHVELLGRYHYVDIALDTQPYSGGLTTCEALWMGVPVVTFPGRTFAGRHSMSHMMNAGYGHFVAEDVTGYIDLAVTWASRLDALALIRSEMRDRVRSSPLCDAPRFGHDLTALLIEIAARRIAK